MPNIPELQQQIVKRYHNSHIAGHPGRWKTLELVSHNYWWPQMSWYWVPILAPVTSVYRQNPTANSLWVSSTLSWSLLNNGA